MMACSLHRWALAVAVLVLTSSISAFGGEKEGTVVSLTKDSIASTADVPLNGFTRKTFLNPCANSGGPKSSTLWELVSSSCAFTVEVAFDPASQVGVVRLSLPRGAARASDVFRVTILGSNGELELLDVCYDAQDAAAVYFAHFTAYPNVAKLTEYRLRLQVNPVLPPHFLPQT
jgi:hypothetical protein